MNSAIKEQALVKMNEEMNQEHSEYEDYIHNWISDQEDDELFEAILKVGKTIKSCFKYIERYAYKMAKRVGNIATYAPSPNQIHSLIAEYLKSEETVVGDVIVSNSTKPQPKSSKAVTHDEICEDGEEELDEVKLSKKAKATKKSEVDLQMSMFDLFGDEVNGNR